MDPQDLDSFDHLMKDEKWNKKTCKLPSGLAFNRPIYWGQKWSQLYTEHNAGYMLMLYISNTLKVLKRIVKILPSFEPSRREKLAV